MERRRKCRGIGSLINPITPMLAFIREVIFMQKGLPALNTSAVWWITGCILIRNAVILS